MAKLCCSRAGFSDLHLEGFGEFSESPLGVLSSRMPPLQGDHLSRPGSGAQLRLSVRAKPWWGTIVEISTPAAACMHACLQCMLQIHRK